MRPTKLADPERLELEDFAASEPRAEILSAAKDRRPETGGPGET